jgi:hypothetical protein
VGRGDEDLGHAAFADAFQQPVAAERDASPRAAQHRRGAPDAAAGSGRRPRRTRSSHAPELGLLAGEVLAAAHRAGSSGLSVSTAPCRPDSWMTRPEAPSSARRGNEQPRCEPAGCGGRQRGVQPQAAIEHDGDARRPRVERHQPASVARFSRRPAAESGRRQAPPPQPTLAVRQRDGRTGAVRDRLQRRAFERRAHDHDRARHVVLAARHARRREHEGAALDRGDARRDADLARLSHGGRAADV